MTWLRGAPDGRVWAIVLWDHSVHHVPSVAQYEPRSGRWIAHNCDWPTDQCSYAPLPHHLRFNAKTHLMEEQP